jgi:hypothetical protein
VECPDLLAARARSQPGEVPPTGSSPVRPPARQLARRVEMAEVPRGLLDEMVQDPARCCRCVDREVVERVGRAGLGATPGLLGVVGRQDAAERVARRGTCRSRPPALPVARRTTCEATTAPRPRGDGRCRGSSTRSMSRPSERRRATPAPSTRPDPAVVAGMRAASRAPPQRTVPSSGNPPRTSRSGRTGARGAGRRRQPQGERRLRATGMREPRVRLHHTGHRGPACSGQPTPSS